MAAILAALIRGRRLLDAEQDREPVRRVQVVEERPGGGVRVQRGDDLVIGRDFTLAGVRCRPAPVRPGLLGLCASRRSHPARRLQPLDPFPVQPCSRRYNGGLQN